MSFAANLQRISAQKQITQSDLARELDVTSQAVNQWYTGATTPRGRRLSQIAKALGVSEGELLGAPGVTAGGASQPKRFPTVLSGDMEHVPALSGVPEIDVIGGLGTGGEAAMEAFTPNGHDIISGDRVRDMWPLPADYLRGELRMTERRARIIEVRGDSMSPTLLSGDRVMIDVGDRTMAAGGLFAIWNGDGVAVKRLRQIRGSDPPRMTLLSDNEHEPPEEVLLEEIRIIGRVVWVARKI